VLCEVGFLVFTGSWIILWKQDSPSRVGPFVDTTVPISHAGEHTRCTQQMKEMGRSFEKAGVLLPQ